MPSLQAFQLQRQRRSRVLHAAARLVLNLRPHDHMSVAALAPDRTMDHLQAVLVSPQVITCQAPEYISNMLKPVADDPSLTTLWKLHHPRTNRQVIDRAFSIAAAKAWNSLLAELKTATCSTDTFKRHLKTCLFKRAYD